MGKDNLLETNKGTSASIDNVCEPTCESSSSSCRLTQFSPGAGCGCKIAPRELEMILRGDEANYLTDKLLVGHETKDDAAVYLINEQQALISTTDFFTPIVDDPYDFGRIAATNALSDIWAMGGVPCMAIAILGWPLDKLPVEMARRVVDGARYVCKYSQIPLAGGHSINISDPIFGLAVNGIISPQKVKKNSSIQADGCLLFLTKPLGVGLITTAQKRGLASNYDLEYAINLMTTPNRVGAAFAQLAAVKAMTDVTGFGLLGHLLEMCEGSDLAAELYWDAIPRIPGIEKYINLKTVPGGTNRNWSSYGHGVGSIGEEQKILLCDPQTSGGLLIAVEDNEQDLNSFFNVAMEYGLSLKSIGRLMKYGSVKSVKNESESSVRIVIR